MERTDLRPRREQSMRAEKERRGERGAGSATGTTDERHARRRTEARGAREHGAERHRPRCAEAGIAHEPQRRERAAGRRHGVPSERARALGAEVVRPEVELGEPHLQR